jgi:hypothetical protein
VVGWVLSLRGLRTAGPRYRGRPFLRPTYSTRIQRTPTSTAHGMPRKKSSQDSDPREVHSSTS